MLEEMDKDKMRFFEDLQGPAVFFGAAVLVLIIAVLVVAIFTRDPSPSPSFQQTSDISEEEKAYLREITTAPEDAHPLSPEEEEALIRSTTAPGP